MSELQVTEAQEPTLTVKTELEDDGRWSAEVVDLPGVKAYGRNDQIQLQLCDIIGCESPYFAQRN